MILRTESRHATLSLAADRTSMSQRPCRENPILKPGAQKALAKPAREPSRTVVEYAIDAIRDAILQGHYAPGQRLIEAELTEQLGLSRGPLREALRRLAADGLIEIAPYRGASVSRMSRVELADMLGVREALEGLAARLAAERIDTHDNRRRAERLQQRLERLRSGDDFRAFIEENDQFHNAIVELSGNTALAKQVAQFQLPTLRAAFFRLIDTTLREHSLAQHREILDAILDADGPRAERVMRNHVRRTAELSRKLPDQLFRN
jgi:DNA-binding GntR family transcriptional regulator